MADGSLFVAVSGTAERYPTNKKNGSDRPPSLPVKLTPPVAAIPRHQPFSRGSPMGAFDPKRSHASLESGRSNRSPRRANVTRAVHGNDAVRPGDHSMTSSARSSTACGIVMPIVRAVLRFTTHFILLDRQSVV